MSPNFVTSYIHFIQFTLYLTVKRSTNLIHWNQTPVFDTLIKCKHALKQNCLKTDSYDEAVINLITFHFSGFITESSVISVM
jgi:hypothetical protein